MPFSRTLDAIYEYGPARFFIDTCLLTVLKHRLLSKMIFIDTTSFYTTGKKYKGSGDIQLVHGYSKDNRMDLRQLVYLLATTKDGLPLLAEAHSGNSSDGDLFTASMLKMQEHLKDRLNSRYFVLDSSLYKKKFLLNKNISGHWITRVPESIKLCKSAVSKEYDASDWIKIDGQFKYTELESNYGKKKQRWLLVCNRASKYKELQTLRNRLDKEEKSIKKALLRMERKVYFSKDEILERIRIQKVSHPNFDFRHGIVGVYKRIRGSRRKIRIGFRVKTGYSRNETRISNLERRKGRFILATNCLDLTKLKSKEILEAYRSRNQAVEGCFKFIKDRKNNFNQIFLKKESRIEAMMMVMSLTVFVNNLAQKKLRSHLKEAKSAIPSQMGKSTIRPTFQWASYLMRHVSKVRIRLQGVIHEEIKGVKTAQETIVKAFGSLACEIYGVS